ncbi:hypothetical protein COM33_16070 [Bacillus toyonensis]|uniref:Uncharacterized protein n=3 Tax=Bacillaceae TaxID=186817 RepID=A0AB36SKM7_9BACI|nr:hypothetical protein IC9_04999 [Bacillus toyonensis]MDF9889119.1 hypothetical protein [Bacillus sp. LEw-kw-24]MDH6560143.1 hypothetical protein [Bacillus sp. LEw-kw-2]MDH8706650.1 hypothetical protein [Stenotrophomonas sp. 1198]MDP9743856.1 hypothetical protein [Bacillus thuringiensis]
MYKLMSSSYYFNILGGGFVVLGGLMLLGMILKQQHMLFRHLSLSIYTQLNYLIGYKNAERNFGHEDPMLTEYTYGESGANTEKLLKVQKGDSLLINTLENGLT